jgi:large conductance mechanosensitive channel
MNALLKDFRDFLLQGDIIALAVAFIMALAFADVVNAFTGGIVTPFISALVGESDFSNIDLDIGDASLEIGALLDEIINLILVGAAVYFFIVKPVQMIRERKAAAGDPVPDPEEVVLLREIRDSLRSRP